MVLRLIDFKVPFEPAHQCSMTEIARTDKGTALGVVAGLQRVNRYAFIVKARLALTFEYLNFSTLLMKQHQIP